MNVESFKARLVASSGGCLLFRGNRNSDGYGMVRFDRSQMGAHRASWLIHRGPNHKLTEAQVREVLSLKGTLSQRALAARYGVSRELIRGIHRGTFWKWIARDLPTKDKRGTLSLFGGDR